VILAPRDGELLGGVTFCCLEATGPDPSTDRLGLIRAVRVSGDRAEEAFERAAEPTDAAWSEFERFAGGSPIVVPDLATFEAWRTHAGRREVSVAIGLVELEELFGPVRRSTAFRDPADLRVAAEAIVQQFRAMPSKAVDLITTGYRKALHGLRDGSPRGAAALELALALAARAGARTSAAEPSDLLDDLAPACEREAEDWEKLDTVPVECDLPPRTSPEDRERLDRIFEELLPRSFATHERAGSASSYRRGQHEVARAVADVLGSGELLLVHAPTGTGKTLAYLVPALLWSVRANLRVGVATFTRALQQQAMDREIPRALESLTLAGVTPLPRVAMLKGRENYLCWRALKLAVPAEDDDGETWLAWSRLAAGALRDPDSDLDRVPLRPPVPLEASGPWRRALADLVRSVRCRSACCTQEADRRNCGAEVARKKAERAHVVITNQAFVLARQEFFKHVVFDECEHLHEQAHSAWSHVLTFRQMRSVLARLHAPDRERAAVLDRLERAVLEGTPTHRAVAAALAAWEVSTGALARLEASIEGFESWRDDVARTRANRESHSLLREFVEHGASEEIVGARRDLAKGLNDLESALAEIAERFDATPLRGLHTLRRSIDLARTEIAEVLEAVEAWLPLAEGKPAYRPSAFYDVEVDARGERALAARVLLPNEVLGREFHPALATGVYVSATTWLRGGFESALGYLGLDRAAQPAEDEDRPPRTVRTFRAPDVFDYSRVLVAVPRDAPPISRDKDRFLDYVRRFVAGFGERTRGRMLVLFTNAADVRKVGDELSGHFRARSIGLYWQNMESASKEELAELFRARVDSVLLGVDTFWFGADFPGETLEYVVIVRLPYGVPDRYHHAQCAALGTSEQWRRIYLPRALAKFRQGFGRLMRRETDKGCVFVLDGRALEPRHRSFLRELPIASELPESSDEELLGGARFVRGDTERCIREALAHMGLAPGPPDA
jgi:ATP-dependent DNA helicase DinG